MAVSLPGVLPVVPVADVHTVRGANQVTLLDTVGWPQLTRAVAAQDAALVRAGESPTSIFAGNYGEAGALDILGSADHLPPVLSGHNTFWLWGPGQASDRTVLVVDADAITDIDYTGTQALGELTTELKAEGITTGIARSSHLVHHDLTHGGLLILLRPNRLYDTVEDAVLALRASK